MMMLTVPLSNSKFIQRQCWNWCCWNCDDGDNDFHNC